MGGSLSYPITTMHIERHRSLIFNAACCHVQGWRPTQEDAHNIIESINNSGIMLFGVYDGHGGSLASEYLQQAIPKAFETITSLSDCQTITNLMLDLDADFIKKEYQDGTTCCIVLAQLWDITTDAAISTPFPEFFKRINYNTDYLLKKTAIKTLSINIGDSRAMIITANAAYQNTLLTNPPSTQQIQQQVPLTPGAMKRRPEYIAITRDHKPSLDTEHQRIVNAMGSVSGNRVDGSLALSRAIGDAPFKNNPLLSPTQQKVIAVPDFELHTMYWGDSLLVCCDGIFEAEKMTYSEVCRVVCRSVQENLNLTKFITVDTSNVSGDSSNIDGEKKGEKAGSKAQLAADVAMKFSQDSSDDAFRFEYADWDPAIIARDLIEQSLLSESKDNNTAIVINFRLPKLFIPSTTSTSSTSTTSPPPTPALPDPTSNLDLQQTLQKHFVPFLLDFLPKVECVPGPYSAMASTDAEWASAYQKDLAANGYTMDDVKAALDILDAILAQYTKDSFEPVKASELTSKIVQTYNQERSKATDITKMDDPVVDSQNNAESGPKSAVPPLLLKSHLFTKKQDTPANINLDMVFHHILRAGTQQRRNNDPPPF